MATTVCVNLISGASKEVTSIDGSTAGETTFTLLLISLVTNSIPSLLTSTIILKLSSVFGK